MNKIYYHGSNEKFNKFDKSKIKENKLGLAFNFTDDINIAYQYGDYIIKAHLDLKNPLTLDMWNKIFPFEWYNKFGKLFTNEPDYEYDKQDYEEFPWTYGDMYDTYKMEPDFISILEEMGYDGISIPEDHHFGVFESEQIHVIDDITESVQSVDRHTYVIDNTEQLVKHLKRKGLAQRIIYDNKKNWYLVSSNDQLTHPLIVEQVYENGFYGFDTDIHKYINQGYLREKGSNTQKPIYLYNFLYTPNTEIYTNFFDGIDHAYSYDDFGCIYTKGFDIVEIPLGEILKEPQQIKENYMTELSELIEKLNKFVVHPVDKSFDEMEDETGMNKVQEEFKVGDTVHLRGQDRKGKVTKIINDEVVEVEFPEEENTPARTDRYYTNELKLSESIMDDVSKKTQEDWVKLNQRYEEIKDLDHEQLVDKLMQKSPFKDEEAKNFFNKQTNNNLIYRLLAKEFADWQVGVFFRKKSIDINEEASFSSLGTTPTPGVKINGNPVEGKSVKKKDKKHESNVSKIDKRTKTMKITEVKKLNKIIESYLTKDKINEIYDVKADHFHQMQIVGYGKIDNLEKYTLDDVEFYKAEDESLKNAIEICIKQEFLPYWSENNGIVEYNVDMVKYDEDTKKGTAYVALFDEEDL